MRNGRAFDGWHSWPFRRRAVLELIRSLDADLLALQEAFGFQLRWLARRLPGYVFVGAGRGRRGRGERTAVAARTSTVEIVDHRTRWFGPTPDRAGTRLPGARFPRTATTVTARVHGMTLRFTNVHLDERSSQNRERSAAQLIGWAKESVPHVVSGDFNASPRARMFPALAAAGFRSALGDAGGGTFHGFSGRTDGPRIDHILVSPDIEVLAAEVVHDRPSGRLASDHWPIVATLSFN